MPKKTSGFLLIFIGIFLAVYKSSWIPFDAFFTLYFLLILVGAMFIFVAFMKSIAPFAFIGGMIATLGIEMWGYTYITGWPTHWSILMILFGVSILLQFMINRSSISAILGSTLILSGTLTCPAIREIPQIAPIASAFSLYWPILLVFFGMVLITDKKGMRREQWDKYETRKK